MLVNLCEVKWSIFRVTAKNPCTKLLECFSDLFHFNWVTQNRMMDANNYFDNWKANYQNDLKGLEKIYLSPRFIGRTWIFEAQNGNDLAKEWNAYHQFKPINYPVNKSSVIILCFTQLLQRWVKSDPKSHKILSFSWGVQLSYTIY